MEEAPEGISLFLCATCEGEVRETTGYYDTGNRVVRNSRRCRCCQGQPFHGCPDRRWFHIEGRWLSEVVERWIENTEFRATLDRKRRLSASEIGRLRYKLGGNHLDGAKFWAFSEAIWKLQRDLTYLGEFQRVTGTKASERLIRWAVAATNPRHEGKA